MENPLTEVLPARVRLYCYAVVSMAGLVFAVWQATDGNLVPFIGGLIAALTSALAGSNVSSTTVARTDQRGASSLLAVLVVTAALTLVCLTSTVAQARDTNWPCESCITHR